MNSDDSQTRFTARTARCDNQAFGRGHPIWARTEETVRQPRHSGPAEMSVLAARRHFRLSLFAVATGQSSQSRMKPPDWMVVHRLTGWWCPTVYAPSRSERPSACVWSESPSAQHQWQSASEICKTRPAARLRERRRQLPPPPPAAITAAIPDQTERAASGRSERRYAKSAVTSSHTESGRAAEGCGTVPAVRRPAPRRALLPR